MSQYIAASIRLSNGEVIRVGPDESQVGDVPTSFTFQTQIPGGFGPASLVIPRPPDLYADDARLFSDVVVYGEGMQTIYEGYVTGLPSQSEREIQIQLSGWSSVLERIGNFRQIFVDRDTSKWRQPSVARQLILLSGGLANSIASVSSGGSLDGTPQLLVAVNEGNIRGEAWFDAGPGLVISKIFFSSIETNQNSPGAPSTDRVRIGFSNSNTAANDPNEIVLPGAFIPFPTNQTYSPTTPSRYAYIQYSVGVDFRGTLEVSNLTVYGNHNVPLTGSNPQGVRAADVIAYMVGATPLNLLPGSIDESAFVIPHLSFTSDISVREAIEQINLLGGNDGIPNDWGVYDNREFFWRNPGSYGKTWRVTSDQISGLRSDGPDSVSRTSGVKINYQDVTGNTVSVGPPRSFSDSETPRLLSIDPDNPAFQVPSYHTENVGLTTQQGAINIGTVILNERNRLNWRGDVELQGEVTDSDGKTYPVHRVRAGDQIIIQDDPDTKPRPINSTTYNHDNLTLSASLGATPDKLDSLLARLAAVTDLIV